MARIHSLTRKKTQVGVKRRFAKTYGEDWSHVKSSVKSLHMVGRTSLNLYTRCEDMELSRLERKIGQAWIGLFLWRTLSPTQRLDLLATEILRQDHVASGLKNKTDRGTGILSQDQFYLRACREISCTLSQIDALCYRGFRKCP